MKHKFLALTLSLLTAFSFSSCIQSESTVTVKTDGSGTIENKTVMGGALMQMMQGFGQQLGGEAGATPPANPMAPDEEKLKAAASDFGEGVTFVGVEEIKEPNGSVGVVAKYAFEDINKVQLHLEDTFGAMKDMGEMGQQMSGQGGAATPEEADEKEDPLTFEFAAGSPAKLSINFPQPEPGDLGSNEDAPAKAETPDPTQMAMAQQMLGDMRFGVKLVVDGEVVESNASYQEGNETTLFSMEMGKMLGDPANMSKMQALENEEDFNKVKETLKDIDGMKFETEEKVTIEFK
jgi:hypothetical protein